MVPRPDTTTHTTHTTCSMPQEESTSIATSTNPTMSSLLLRLPQDIFMYQLFPLLEDGDAMDCFETCKQLYYHYTWHYRIKNVIDLNSFYTRPAYCSVSGKNPVLPRPKIIRGDLLLDEASEIVKAILSHCTDGNLELDLDMDRIMLEKTANDSRAKIWRKLINTDCEMEKERIIYDCNFKLFPMAEFESLEELDLITWSRWDSPPFWPPNLKKLNLRLRNKLYNNQVLMTGLFPATLKYLEIDSYSHILFIVEPDAFPQGLETLILSSGRIQFTDELKQEDFPFPLKKLSFSIQDADATKQISSKYLPSTLQTLMVNFTSEHRIIDTFPSGLKSLTLRSCPWPLANALPSSLETLKLTYFSQSLTKILPPSLTELHLLDFENVLHTGDLHFGLRILNIRASWRNPLHLEPGVFPQSLRYLTLSNTSLRHIMLPEGLLEFNVEYCYGEFEPVALPSSLKVLGLPRNTQSFSTLTDILATLPNLSTLLLEKLHSSNNLSADTIPSTVKYLKIKETNDINLSSLLINRLEIGKLTSYANIIHGMLPQSLKELQLHETSKEKFMPGALPDSLEKLELRRYEHPFDAGVLPSSLKHLKLNADYQFPLTTLPSNLLYLYLDIDAADNYYNYCNSESYLDEVCCRRPFVRIPKANMPIDLQIHLTKNKDFHIRRYMYTESASE